MLRSCPDKPKEAFIRAIPFRRFAKPQEVADAVLFFASSRSDYVTGQVFERQRWAAFAGWGETTPMRTPPETVGSKTADRFRPTRVDLARFEPRHFLWQLDGKVATITLNRPAKLNAITSAMTDLLEAAVRRCNGSDDIRCVVLTGAGGFVEVQGTAEGEPFSREDLARLMELAGRGISQLVALQRAALE